MKYLSVEQMAQRWGLAPRTVRNYCAGGRIPGAALLGKTWSIPETAKRPDRAKRENEPATLLSILRREKESHVSGGIYHKVQIELTYNSNRIEGSKLTDREVEKLLSNLAIQSFETRDQQEVAGYAELMDLVFSAWRDIPFNENHVKQLHQILLRHSEKDSRHRGQYKTHSNSVAAFDEAGAQVGIVFETASPFDTPRLMAELVAWVNGEREKAALHPLLIIAIFVVVFLEIHPFQDGNGRLSRVLTTLLLIQAGYAYVPYSSLESVIELNKEAYYLALRKTQGSIRTDAPDWQPWLVFFLRSLAEQVRRLEKKVEREKIVLATMPELSLRIVELAREHGRVTIGDAIRLTGASRNTLKQHFRQLVERGHLNQQGAGRGVWYGLK